eukprot:gene2176-4234_t
MKNIFDYLVTQPGETIDNLYGARDGPSVKSQSPWACMAIFQSLSPLAKAYIMRIVFNETSIKASDMFSWIQTHATADHNMAIDQLINLRIFLGDASSIEKISENRHFRLNKFFQRSIKHALCHPTEPWSSMAIVPHIAEEYAPSVEVLNKYSTDMWENMLYFLVKGEAEAYISDTVKSFLVTAGLMCVDKEGNRCLRISAKGYEYMLQSTQSQVWVFVFECLKRSGEGNGQGMGREELLLFLFTLSYCQLGRGYLVDALSPTQQRLLTEFKHLGIIYQSRSRPDIFYPTRLAISMLLKDHQQAISPSIIEGSKTSSSSTVDKQSSQTQSLVVIVQTNFQVTAYLSSPLHQAMLGLFVDLRIKLPNTIFGTITRDSIKEAYRLGITARQIINFLSVHHRKDKDKDKVRDKSQGSGSGSGSDPSLPENVTDQLLLWENEKNKVMSHDAVYVAVAELASGARLEEIFEALLAFAKSEETLLWESGQDHALAVTPEGYGALVTYAQSQGII